MTEQAKAYKERLARLTKGLDFDNDHDDQVRAAIHTITCRSGIALESWQQALRRVFGERETEVKR